MAAQTVVMPQLGESIFEGSVVKWLVNEGDRVSVDDPLCEIETAKANAVVYSTAEGYVSKLVAPLKDVVSVGETLVEISGQPVAGGSAPAAAPAVQAAPSVAGPAVQATMQAAPVMQAMPAMMPAPVMVPAAPAFGVTSGSPFPGGDLAQLIQQITAAAPMAAPVAASEPAKPAKAERWLPFGHPAGVQAYRYPQPVIEEGDKVEKFNRRREMIAEHMVISHAVSPHVVTVAEVDMTNLVVLREANKDRLKAQGIGLTFLSFLLKATVEALGEYPLMNSVVGNRETIMKKRVHLGCAVETDGGLVVPVIRDADQYNTVGLSKALARLSKKARENALEPEDVTGGTFTVSNPGLKGNLYGGAIINQPQVGIVRMGEIKKRAMVITRDGQDVIAIRSMMYLALSYDHRIIDGVTGNSFLYRIRELLEAAKFSV